MSRIICDICGTSYPESAEQCPICGCVRSAEAKVVAGNTNVTSNGESGSYTYVKGGRFSKANVKRRTGVVQTPPVSKRTEEKPQKNDKGLAIAVAVLALAIIAVIIYIAVKFFVPFDQSATGTPQTGDSQPKMTQDTAGSTEGTTLEIPCTSVKLSDSIVELKKLGAIQLISVTTTPADTTDTLLFRSEDEKVAVVDKNGKVTAVAPGETAIVVTCGAVEQKCVVKCTFEVEETTAPTTEPVTVPAQEFKLLKEDVTFSYKGESWICYSGDIDTDDIIWSSDDEKIATVTDGKVVAVSAGVTRIRGKYNDVEAVCIIRCSATVGAYVTPSDETTTAPTEADSFLISSTDVTIAIGESFNLTLKDSGGQNVDVTWTVSNSCCTAEGNTVTGQEAGTAKVYTAHNGKEYSCIVRVKSGS